MRDPGMTDQFTIACQYCGETTETVIELDV
jgi:hypothetical protein